MILVTGATGSIGSQLVKQLDAQGQKVRALVRDPKKGESLKGKNVEIAQGDLTRPDTLDKAFAGVDGVFVVVNANEHMVQMEKNAFDAAKKAGAKHVVLLSVAGADAQSPIKLATWHAESEKNLKATGLGHTILQPTSFMQNTLMSAGSIKGESKMYGAFKNGRVPVIDVADIAAVAASVLTSPGSHNGKTYYLTGPEPLTQAQIAEKISKATGKAVSYVDIPSSALVENLTKMGMPAWFAKDYGVMSDFYATDQGSHVSPDVENVAGRKPRTFDAFLADTAKAFT